MADVAVLLGLRLRPAVVPAAFLLTIGLAASIYEAFFDGTLEEELSVLSPSTNETKAAPALTTCFGALKTFMPYFLASSSLI